MNKINCLFCGDEQPKGGGGSTHLNGRIGARVSWGWIEALAGFIASILLLFFLQSILYVVGLMMTLSTNPFSLLRPELSFNVSTMSYKFELGLTLMTPELLSFVTISELALLVIPALYLKLRGFPLRELGFNFINKKTTATDIAIGGLVGIGMMITAHITSTISSIALLAILQSIYGPLLGQLLLLLAEEFISEINAPFGATNPAQLALLILSVTLLVAPCEEIATRGFLQQGLEKSWGRWKGLTAAAVIFSILHVIFYPQNTSITGLPIGVISVILALPTYIVLSLTLGALLQLREYRIITTIVAHASYMTLLVVLLSM